jgi:N4-gp56 family major capsid protein
MADINLGSLTSTTDLTNTIKSFYDRMLLEVLDPATKFYQFATLKPLPGGEGTSVIWNRPTRLSVGQKLAPGIKPSANELSTSKVSALIETYGGYVVLEDLVQLTSITDVMNLATERLAIQAAETIDRSIMQSIVNHADLPGVSAVHYIKASAGQYLSTAGFVANVYSNTLIAVSDVRAVATELRRRAASPYDGENFVGIIHPVVEEDLTSDSTWQNWHQYTTPEFLYRGEIGRVHGVRFVRSQLAPISAGSADGQAMSGFGISALAYGTPIFGRGFYGATELDGGIKTYTVQGASKSDPLNQETTYGWKAFFTSKILNVSSGVVLWSGSNDTFNQSAASARETAGLNIAAIPTAS